MNPAAALVAIGLLVWLAITGRIEALWSSLRDRPTERRR